MELTQQMNNKTNLSVLNPGCVPGGSIPAGFILKRQSLIFSCGTNKVKIAFLKSSRIPLTLLFPVFQSRNLFLS